MALEDRYVSSPANAAFNGLRVTVDAERVRVIWEPFGGSQTKLEEPLDGRAERTQWRTRPSLGRGTPRS